MGFHLIGFLAFLFVGFTTLNRILEGQFITAADVSIMNTLTITRDQSIFGLFTVPVINTDFFFTGIPRLVKWDYSFFGGNAQLIQYLLYSLTAVASFLIFLAIIPLVYNFFKSIF